MIDNIKPSFISKLLRCVSLISTYELISSIPALDSILEIINADGSNDISVIVDSIE